MAKKTKRVIENVISPITKEGDATTPLAKDKTKSTLITGYQYGEHGEFIGEYRFEKNLDKEEVHCPACTALCAPPVNLATDEEAYFNGEQWQVRKLTLPWLPDLALPNSEEAANGN